MRAHAAILDAWIEKTSQIYPEQARNSIAREQERFRNPVGFTVRESLATLLARARRRDGCERTSERTGCPRPAARGAGLHAQPRRSASSFCCGRSFAEHHARDQFPDLERRIDELALTGLRPVREVPRRSALVARSMRRSGRMQHPATSRDQPMNAVYALLAVAGTDVALGIAAGGSSRRAWPLARRSFLTQRAPIFLVGICCACGAGRQRRCPSTFPPPAASRNRSPGSSPATLDNPSTGIGACVAAWPLEILLFRSLFRNTRASSPDGRADFRREQVSLAGRSGFSLVAAVDPAPPFAAVPRAGAGFVLMLAAPRRLFPDRRPPIYAL